MAGDKMHDGKPWQPIMRQRKGIGDAAVASGFIVDVPPRNRIDSLWGETSKGPVASGLACGTKAS